MMRRKQLIVGVLIACSAMAMLLFMLSSMNSGQHKHTPSPKFVKSQQYIQRVPAETSYNSVIDSTALSTAVVIATTSLPYSSETPTGGNDSEVENNEVEERNNVDVEQYINDLNELEEEHNKESGTTEVEVLEQTAGGEEPTDERELTEEEQTEVGQIEGEHTEVKHTEVEQTEVEHTEGEELEQTAGGEEPKDEEEQTEEDPTENNSTQRSETLSPASNKPDYSPASVTLAQP